MRLSGSYSSFCKEKAAPAARHLGAIFLELCCQEFKCVCVVLYVILSYIHLLSCTNYQADKDVRSENLKELYMYTNEASCNTCLLKKDMQLCFL